MTKAYENSSLRHTAIRTYVLNRPIYTVRTSFIKTNIAYQGNNDIALSVTWSVCSDKMKNINLQLRQI